MLLDIFDRKTSAKNRGRCLFFSRKCSRKSFGAALRNLKAQIGMKSTESRLPTLINFSYKTKSFGLCNYLASASDDSDYIFQLCAKKKGEKCTTEKWNYVFVVFRGMCVISHFIAPKLKKQLRYEFWPDIVRALRHWRWFAANARLLTCTCIYM